MGVYRKPGDPAPEWGYSGGVTDGGDIYGNVTADGQTYTDNGQNNGWGLDGLLDGNTLDGFPRNDKPNTDPRDGALLDLDWAEQNPMEANAEIINAQQDDFRERFLPLERDALRQAMDFDFTEEARRSGQEVANAYDRQRSGVYRNMSRFGIRPTGQQMQFTNAALDRNKALGIVNAENSTRRKLYDRNIQAISDLAAHGKGIATGAMAGMSDAAGFARDIQNQNNANKANEKSGLISTIGSLAMMFLPIL